MWGISIQMGIHFQSNGRGCHLFSSHESFVFCWRLKAMGSSYLSSLCADMKIKVNVYPTDENWLKRSISKDASRWNTFKLILMAEFILVIGPLVVRYFRIEVIHVSLVILLAWGVFVFLLFLFHVALCSLNDFPLNRKHSLVRKPELLTIFFSSTPRLKKAKSIQSVWLFVLYRVLSEPINQYVGQP